MADADSIDLGKGAWFAIGGAVGTAVTFGLALLVLIALNEGPSFTGASSSGSGGEGADGTILAVDLGCVACHSVDGVDGVGPSWLGLAGSERRLGDGTTVVADAAYLKESITDPAAALVEGFADSMPKDLGDRLSAAELEALVTYIESFAG